MSELHSIKIDIPQPCTEKWNEMQVMEEGRHCSSCQKCVVDFTRFSDAELLRYFSSAHQKNVCGRFERKQLNRLLLTPGSHHRRNTGHWWSSVALISLIGANHPAKAQQAPAALDTIIENNQNPTEQKPATENKQPIPADSLWIKGRIVDSLTKEPLQGATLAIKGSTIGVIADEKGEFKLLIPKKYNHPETRIVCAYVGYELEEYRLADITNKQDLEIMMKEGNVLIGLTVTATIKTPFWQRLKMWFRGK